MTKPKIILAIAVAIGLTACGDSGAPGASRAAGGVFGGCNAPEPGLCLAWSGTMTASEGEFAGLCEGTLGGTYSAGDCAEEDLIGSCFTDQCFGLLLTYSYYASDFDLATAEADCLMRATCSDEYSLLRRFTPAM